MLRLSQLASVLHKWMEAGLMGKASLKKNPCACVRATGQCNLLSHLPGAHAPNGLSRQIFFFFLIFFSSKLSSFINLISVVDYILAV